MLRSTEASRILKRAFAFVVISIVTGATAFYLAETAEPGSIQCVVMLLTVIACYFVLAASLSVILICLFAGFGKSPPPNGWEPIPETTPQDLRGRFHF